MINISCCYSFNIAFGYWVLSTGCSVPIFQVPRTKYPEPLLPFSPSPYSRQPNDLVYFDLTASPPRSPSPDVRGGRSFMTLYLILL